MWGLRNHVRKEKERRHGRKRIDLNRGPIKCHAGCLCISILPIMVMRKRSPRKPTSPAQVNKVGKW